jgi:hypothetical protein
MFNKNYKFGSNVITGHTGTQACIKQGKCYFFREKAYNKFETLLVNFSYPSIEYGF